MPLIGQSTGTIVSYPESKNPKPSTVYSLSLIVPDKYKATLTFTSTDDAINLFGDGNCLVKPDADKNEKRLDRETSANKYIILECTLSESPSSQPQRLDYSCKLYSL